MNFSSRQTIYRQRKMIPVFLCIVGGTTYRLLRNLLVLASPKDKSFKEIVDTLKAHFEPKLLVIGERFHFHRNQNFEEFQHFLASNGVKHPRCALYHPSSNRAVEQLVQTVKQALKSRQSQGVSLETTLATFLMQYRSTPHATLQPSYFLVTHCIIVWTC